MFYVININVEVKGLGTNNSKKILVGALSAVAASVAAGIFVKKSIDKKSEAKPKKEKKRDKNIYYTVALNDIYNSYDDKTLSEEDMIEAIRKETSL